MLFRKKEEGVCRLHAPQQMFQSSVHAVCVHEREHFVVLGMELRAWILLDQQKVTSELHSLATYILISWGSKVRF